MRCRLITVLLIGIVALWVGGAVFAQSAEEWNVRGDERYDARDFNAAIECYTKAIELNPELSLVYFSRASAYSNLGRYEEAIDDYTTAIKLSPEFAQLYGNRGAAFNELGRYEEALADLDRAIDLDPDYANAYNNRGYAYYMLGDMKKTRADLKRACEMGFEPACQNYEAIK
jgi:tetratricopeptide (TPR) repeat protein